MSERLTDEEIDEALQIAKSLNSLRLTAAVAELKERRAADLTAGDVEALKDAAGHLRSRGGEVKARAARVINRIITDAITRGAR